MDAEWIITVFLILDELCTKGGRQTHKLAHGCEAEVLTVAVVAARYFQNHQERALLVLRELSYLQRDLSVSRFNLCALELMVRITRQVSSKRVGFMREFLWLRLRDTEIITKDLTPAQKKSAKLFLTCYTLPRHFAKIPLYPM